MTSSCGEPRCGVHLAGEKRSLRAQDAHKQAWQAREERETKAKALRAAERRVIDATIAEGAHDERSPAAAGARVERREAVAALLALRAPVPATATKGEGGGE